MFTFCRIVATVVTCLAAPAAPRPTPDQAIAVLRELPEPYGDVGQGIRTLDRAPWPVDLYPAYAPAPPRPMLSDTPTRPLSSQWYFGPYGETAPIWPGIYAFLDASHRHASGNVHYGSAPRSRRELGADHGSVGRDSRRSGHIVGAPRPPQPLAPAAAGVRVRDRR